MLSELPRLRGPDMTDPVAGVARGPWRLAIVLPYDRRHAGGVADTAIAMAARLRARGHTVHLVTGDDGEGSADPMIRPIPSWVVSVPLNGSISRIVVPTGPESDQAIDRLLARERYDALIVHEPVLPLGQALLSRSTSANVGVVHAFSEQGPPPWLDVSARRGHLDLVAMLRRRQVPLWLLRDLLTPGLDRLHALAAVSPAAAEFARSYLELPAEIVPNGVDVDAFSAAREAPLAPDPTVLFLGRPEPRKGLAVLLDAFAHLARLVPRARLEVAGAGDEIAWAPYRAQVERLGLAGRVAFLGPVSEAEKRAALGRAWVLAVPSLGGESQGKVLLEGLSAGVLVVASRIPGYAEVLTDGVNGLLAPPGNAPALAAVMRRVLVDRKLACRLATQGLETVRERYDWRVITPRIEAVVARAIAIRRQEETVTWAAGSVA
ncbi:glycosyltransferase family 4 protein [Thermomicrobiaceae bacterium CFH 74404]|uniref:Glycosyltransferase family 4 protein n=1 Tax=Thermalbibacter longus TaxID=2951981 RepID=A0AA41W9G0_9BACT|nr:glycosyltransferase family 4 protein [Thermalbibacter longus]MCM8748144.1 glycosyltransferase family 4 protein [Thermalbibacter longus]